MYFLDSDVVRKTAQFNLFDELAYAYEIGLNSFAVLPELKYQLHIADKEKSIEKLGNEESYLSLYSFIDAAEEIDFIPSDAANKILELDQSNLDTGEQVLLAAVSSTENSKMISGDKRAFVAISKIEEFEPIDCLWPLLICFENALYKIIHMHKDFDNISEKIRKRQDADSALKIAFGVSSPSPIDSVIQALDSFIHDLIAKTSGKYVKS